jgi:hypothetical protein
VTQPENNVPWKWQLIVTIGLLLLFVVFAVWMLALADTTDTVWKNRVYVFGSVEAIVFAAGGWLFGREVNRTQVETAREDAGQARQEAEQKTREAADAQQQAAVTEERGRGLVDAIELTRATAPVRPSGSAQRGGDIGLNTTGAGSDPQLDALHELGRKLFPERLP